MFGYRYSVAAAVVRGLYTQFAQRHHVEHDRPRADCLHELPVGTGSSPLNREDRWGSDEGYGILQLCRLLVEWLRGINPRALDAFQCEPAEGIQLTRVARRPYKHAPVFLLTRAIQLADMGGTIVRSGCAIGKTLPYESLHSKAR